MTKKEAEERRRRSLSMRERRRLSLSMRLFLRQRCFARTASPFSITATLPPPTAAAGPDLRSHLFNKWDTSCATRNGEINVCVGYVAVHSMMQPLCRHVAVIGAAGLVAARELRREGHNVVILERGDQIGGTWVYTDPNGSVVHSSMYQSLRTNLPREIMGFREYPFMAKEEFGIRETVRFESEVVFVGLVEGGKWKVKSKSKRGEVSEEVYDAVVVCNGHYTEPRISSWQGKQFHSHNYRTPEPFQDQVVILIGSSVSAIEISRDIAGVAKEVHIASRSVADETMEKKPGYDNMWLHSMIKSVHEDGSVVFPDGSVVFADSILHCTGYKYHFPFLETNGVVTVDDNRVGPLYKHVFPPALAPLLSFVGIPFKVVPFALYEFQSKWIAGILSNRIALLPEEEMMEDVQAFYSLQETSNIPKRFTHMMDNYQCGCPASEEWRQQMWVATFKNARLRGTLYREEWDDHQLILQAHEDFRKYTLNGVSMDK
ncbi:hypothetical protein ACLB2K_048628 [Fragaria x ananassa]